MDAHLHSRFSRATSQNMNVESLYLWAKYKGIDIIGTGDFTHPFWLAELKEKLKEEGNGLLRLKESLQRNATLNRPEPFFILTSEISIIFSQASRVRKIHLIIFAPSFSSAERLNKEFEKIGNLYADGRPVFGISSIEVLKIILETCPECLVVPAHVWTPWFSVFGSNSGFDSIEECFGNLTSEIYALETGLSSDPAMNWRLSKLDRYTLLSFSDAHSPANLGREAVVFELKEPSYNEIIEAIKNKDRNKILYTVEFFPEEGKYHFDGHRVCGVCLSPKESIKLGNKCSKCGRVLTVGVLHRVEKLADRPAGFKPQDAIGYKSLVPLEEIIAEVRNQKKGAISVFKEYQNIIKNIAPELPLLIDLPLKELQGKIDEKILIGIEKVRKGEVEKIPGYDGVYGVIKLKKEKESLKGSQQKQQTLF